MAEVKGSKIEDVAADLRSGIREGHYPSGESLPAERKLAEQYHVSRSTIEDALGILESEGLIETIARAGAMVLSPLDKIIVGPSDLQPEGVAGFLRPSSNLCVTALGAHDSQLVMQFVEPPAIAAASDDIAERMPLNSGTEVLRRYSICYFLNKPYHLIDRYYPAVLFEDFDNTQSEYIFPLQWLSENKGMSVGKTFERMNACYPTVEERILLKRTSSRQFIQGIERWVWSDNGTLLEYSRIFAIAAYHTFISSPAADSK